jgi:AbrB family looped-hinge helix DNA binding protein
MRVRASTKGQIVLPAEMRRKYRVEPGQELELVDSGSHMCLVPVHRDPVRELRGLLKGETSLTKALLDSRREERTREDGGSDPRPR